MPEFVQCRDLCGLFYQEIIRPALDAVFPGLPYAAALIGGGSEVLGFDDVISSDHDWGPHVTLFLHEDDYDRNAEAVRAAVNKALPASFHGYRVSVGPPSHDYRCTQVRTLRSFIESYLGFDPTGDIRPLDWLTFPEQKLRTLTAGAVFHDGVGLERLRARFAYYPRDVWLYLLLAGWCRIGQEEHLMGRAGSVGDEVGAAIIASRLVRDLMRLCFLMERQYAPYPKWFGTAFAKLKCADGLLPILRRIQLAPTWRDREEHFEQAWQHLGALHNALDITETVRVEYSVFHTRPYRVCSIRGSNGSFVDAMRGQIKDSEISRLSCRGLFGGLDQWSDSTDILDNSSWRGVLRELYEFAAR